VYISQFLFKTNQFLEFRCSGYMQQTFQYKASKVWTVRTAEPGA